MKVGLTLETEEEQKRQKMVTMAVTQMEMQGIHTDCSPQSSNRHRKSEKKVGSDSATDKLGC